MSNSEVMTDKIDNQSILKSLISQVNNKDGNLRRL